MISIFNGIKNMVGKGYNVTLTTFSLFSYDYFKHFLFQGHEKSGLFANVLKLDYVFLGANVEQDQTSKMVQSSFIYTDPFTVQHYGQNTFDRTFQAFTLPPYLTLNQITKF